MRAAAILLVTILCAGCATTGTVQIEKGEELLANSQKYLLSLDQVSYEKINLEEPVKFAFGEEATILQEGEKRRFAKGFALPTEKGTYSVNITSYKGGTLYNPAIMYP